MTPSRVCILFTDGINCDAETSTAFAMAGGRPEHVHVNQLRDGSRQLSDFQILAISGGFSYGDDIRAGQILATELVTMLVCQLREFVERGGLILGICNGFQVLVRTGLLPFNTIGQTSVSLTVNTSGKFECRWVRLGVENTRCVFTCDMEHEGTTVPSPQGLRTLWGRIELPVAHKEGKFIADSDTIARIEREGLVALRYDDADGIATTYPKNPNGSINGIAGVCDATGRILGLMPHPERFVVPTQHPNWRRPGYVAPYGLRFFQNAVKFFA